MTAADSGHHPDAPPALAPRFRTLRTIGALMLREMGSTYGRSPGGYVWAILSPVGAIAVMSVLFSLVVRAPSLGTSFELFYATGFLPFAFYMSMAQKIGAAIRYSRPLLAYPGVTWIDAVLARFLLTVLTETMVFCIVIAAVFSIIDTHTVIDVVPIIEGLGLAALTGLGVGLINCLLIGYAKVWDQIWSIVNRPLFIASGVFFLYEDMPPLVQ
ncbi:MAG: ABC transporter permease, partial [Chthoniobacterales bacterium]